MRLGWGFDNKVTLHILELLVVAKFDIQRNIGLMDKNWAHPLSPQFLGVLSNNYWTFFNLFIRIHILKKEQVFLDFPPWQPPAKTIQPVAEECLT